MLGVASLLVEQQQLQTKFSILSEHLSQTETQHRYHFFPDRHFVSYTRARWIPGSRTIPVFYDCMHAGSRRSTTPWYNVATMQGVHIVRLPGTVRAGVDLFPPALV